MATAEELLEGLLDASGEPYFVIDEDLRTIAIPDGYDVAGVENDKDVNYIPFKMPRMFNGIDLSEFVIWINYVNEGNPGDVFLVEERNVTADEITFRWKVGRHALISRGTLSFVVCLRKQKTDSYKIDQEFNTTITTLRVLPGYEVEPGVVEDYSDIIAQLVEQYNAAFNSTIETFETQATSVLGTANQALETARQAYATIASRVDRLEKRDIIQNEKMEGILYHEEFDNTEAYSKTVPAGAATYAPVHSIGGKTVVWNQLFSNNQNTFRIGLNWVIEGNRIRVSGTPTSADATSNSYNFNPIKGHKYFIDFDSASFGESGFFTMQHKLTGLWANPTKSFIVTVGDTDTLAVFPTIKAAVGEQVNYDSRVIIVDLTMYCGAGNEPTTITDPRIEFVKAWAAEHPEYNAGELLSAEVIEVESRSNNLIAHPYYHTTRTVNGISYTDNGDGTVTLNGTATANSTFSFSQVSNPQHINGSVVTLSGFQDSVSAEGIEIRVYPVVDGQQVTDNITISSGTPIRSKDWSAYSEFFGYVRVAVGSTVNNVTIKPKLEYGNVATPYTKYGPIGTFPIPQAVRDLCPGYGVSAGTAKNEINLDGKYYDHVVGAVDLGTLEYDRTTGAERTLFNALVPNIVTYSNSASVPNVISAMYVAVSQNATWKPGVVSMNTATDRVHRIYLATAPDEYASAAEFKAAMSGVMLYYELANPERIDLSSVLSDDNYIPVEPNGTLTFKNSHGDAFKLPVPSSVSYAIDINAAL